MTVQPKHARRLLQPALSKGHQGDAFKRALRDAQRNIDKLSTQGLKAAYNGIIGAISKGNEEMVDKAIDVATQESAILCGRNRRTEKARAYIDGVMYHYAHDPDCVSFRCKLSSRHPCDDICDLYAHTDLWGMGEGIFPKDKLPKLPVHPNCMCRVVPIFYGSMRVTSEEPKDKTLAGGLVYIMSLTEMQCHSLLGVNGAKEVQKGASWKQYARGYSDEVMQCRITNGIMQAGRPANEQDELKQFVFIGDKKTTAEKIASVNPHNHEGKEWQINCQRCVVAEELQYRGYNVTAKPYANDSIGMDAFSCWDFDLKNYSEDNGFVLVGRKAQFKNLVDKAFIDWGKDARAIVRVQWLRKYGGGGHVFSVHMENGDMIYTDPQSNKIRDIDDTLEKCTNAPWRLWLMRVDHRKLTKLVAEAVENTTGGDKNE